MSDCTIRAEGVTLHYGPVRAVDGVDLAVDHGQILALLGPSGCGKTSFLRLVAGLEEPDAGCISINGQVVADDRRWVPPERRRVGVVFQDFALFPHLTVAANVGFGLRGPARSRQPRIAQALRLVGLEEKQSRYPQQLSGGEQQRVALARALAPEPAVVLLDEPFSNLDAALRSEVRGDVGRILRAAGATAVFVTHDQEEALALADQVAVMNAGRIHQLARPEVLYHEPHDRTVASLVGDGELVPGVRDGEVVHTDLGALPLARPANGARRLEVLLRPEHLRLAPDEDGDAVVVGREFYGHDQILFVRLDSGRLLRARLGPVSHLTLGDRCRVAVTQPVRAFPTTVEQL